MDHVERDGRADPAGRALGRSGEPRDACRKGEGLGGDGLLGQSYLYGEAERQRGEVPEVSHAEAAVPGGGLLSSADDGDACGFADPSEEERGRIRAFLESRFGEEITVVYPGDDFVDVHKRASIKHRLSPF